MPDTTNSEETTRLESQGRRNLALRRQLRQSQLIADNLFETLCADDRSAEWAMGELWGSGYFDCGPQDYVAIVIRCLEVLSTVSRTNPAPTNAKTLCASY